MSLSLAATFSTGPNKIATPSDPVNDLLESVVLNNSIVEPVNNLPLNAELEKSSFLYHVHLTILYTEIS